MARITPLACSHRIDDKPDRRARAIVIDDCDDDTHGVDDVINDVEASVMVGVHATDDNVQLLFMLRVFNHRTPNDGTPINRTSALHRSASDARPSTNRVSFRMLCPN